MKFTIPKQIIVLGEVYKVTIEDLTNMHIDGYCDFKEKRIVLSKDVKKDFERYCTTMIHEIGHAVFEESGLHQTSVSSDIEEIIVEQMSRVIHSNFRIFNVRK